MREIVAPSQLAQKAWSIARGLSQPSSIAIIRYRIFACWQRLRQRAHDQLHPFDGGRDLEPILKELPFEPTGCQAISKIIFQTWKSRVAVPAQYRYWRSTLLRYNPEFQFVLWDDDDNREFIADQFPWFLSTYDSFPAPIFQADAVRPFFLFRYGGVYVDMDTECLQPLSTMPTSGDVVLGQMGPKVEAVNAIPNAIMASKPFQLFWLLVIALMIEKAGSAGVEALRKAGPEHTTGPAVLHEAFDFYRSQSEQWIRARAEPVLAKLPEHLSARLQVGRIELLGPDQWYPIDWTNPIHQWLLRRFLLKRKTVLGPADTRLLFPKSTLVTYWAHSW